MMRFILALALAVFSMQAAGQTRAQRNCKIANCTCALLPYPAESIRKGEEGEVRMQVKVSASGSVQDVQVERSSGYPRLDKVAVDMARQSCYRPAIDQHGRPVDGVATLTSEWRIKR